MFAYQCPVCGTHHHLHVMVRTFARIVHTDEGFETHVVPMRHHEWDNDSEALCLNCGWAGQVGKAEMEEEDELQS